MNNLSSYLTKLVADASKHLTRYAKSGTQSFKGRSFIASAEKLEYEDACREGATNTVTVVLEEKGTFQITSTFLKQKFSAFPKQKVVLDQKMQATLSEILDASRLKSLLPYFKIKNIQALEARIKKVGVAAGASELLVLDFSYKNKSVYKVPILFVNEATKRLSNNLIKLRANSYLDWAKLRQHVKEESLDEILPTVEIRNLDLQQVKKGLTFSNRFPINDFALLNTIRDLRQEKYKVSFRLISESQKSEWVEICAAECDCLSTYPGIYFDSSGNEINKFIQANNSIKKPNLYNAFLVDDTNTSTKNKTHVVAPVPDADYKRLAVKLSSDDLKQVIASPEYSTLPLIELKTPIYNYYCDIDLDWKRLSGNKDIMLFKKQQLTYFAGKKVDFARLVDILGIIFPQPKVKENVEISFRSNNTSEKEGYHLIFKNLQLKNNAIQGLFISGLIEKNFAKQMIQDSQNPIHRFLAQVILDDMNYLKISHHPIQFYLTKELLYLLDFDPSFDVFQKAIIEGVRLFTLSGQNNLNSKQSAQVINFGINLLNEKLIEHYYQNFKTLRDKRIRYKLIIGMVRRIRWEIRRRIHLLDHSVYARGMGLRMLGNQKPDDLSSIYTLSKDRNPTKLEILASSIRSDKTTSTPPSDRFADLWTKVNKQKGFRIIRIVGLFNPPKISSKSIFIRSMQMEFKVSDPITNSVLLRSYKLKRVYNTKLSDYVLEPPSVMSDERSPLWIKHLGKQLLVYPPQRKSRKEAQESRRQLFSSPPATLTTTFRSRVFIPSPAVAGPFLDDYEGDNRGESPDQGSSRIDIEVTVDLVTGDIVERNATFGPSRSYDSNDTTAVPNQPGWWLDINPGATPTNEDTLTAVLGDNVSVETSRAANGNIVVNISYDAALPLQPLAPPINGTYTLEIDLASGQVIGNTTHDGFPQHTLYCNGQLIYNHDPVSEGNGPNDLFGDSDIQKSFTKSIPPRVPNSASGQDQSEDELLDGQTPIEDYYGVGFSWEEEVSIVKNEDDSVTVLVGDNTETFEYDDDDSTWAGDNGSLIEADDEFFGDLSDSSDDSSSTPAITIGGESSSGENAEFYMEVNGERVKLNPEDVYFN